MAAELKSFRELWLEAWERYQYRAWTLLGVLLVSTLVLVAALSLAAGLAVAAGGGVQSSLEAFADHRMDRQTMIAMTVLIVLGSLLALWAECALMAAVLDDDASLADALRDGWNKLWSFSFVFLLYTGIVMAGFLLLFFPGLIFAVWFFFGLFFLLEADYRGMRALQASRAIVRGRFWNVLIKFLLIWLISMVISLVPWVGQVLSLLFTPFLLLFLAALYRNLKETAELPSRLNYGHTLWGGLSILGLIVPVLGVIGAVATLGPQLPEILLNGEEPVMGRQVPDSPRPEAVEPGPVVRGPSEMEQVEIHGGAIWRDPIGDSWRDGAGDLLDIQGVTVLHGTESLEMTIHLARPLEAFFSAEHGSSGYARLASFFLDVDMDRATGGTAVSGNERTGYDFSVELIAEAGGDRQEEGRVHAALFRIRGEEHLSLGPLTGSQVGFSGKTVRFSLPYSIFGGLPGESVRICYLEGVQEAGSALSKDKVLEL